LYLSTKGTLPWISPTSVLSIDLPFAVFSSHTLRAFSQHTTESDPFILENALQISSILSSPAAGEHRFS
jgi:hypothetical protein